MLITLDDKKYVATAVQEDLVQPLSAAIRTTGVQRRADNTKVNKFVFDDWSAGIGWRRIRRTSGRGIGGMRDSNCLTIHPSQITLGILHEAQTTTGSPDDTDHIRKYVNYKGDLWGFFEKDYASDSVTLVGTRNFDAANDDWHDGTDGGSIDAVDGGNTTRGLRVYDAIVHQGQMWCAITNPADDSGADSIVLKKSTSGSSFSDVGTTTEVKFAGATTTENRRNNIEDDIARLLSFGDTLMLAHWDSANDRVTVSWSTDPEAVSPTFNTGAQIQSPSGNAKGPKALVEWYTNTTAPVSRAPVLVLSTGVYRVDSDGSTFDELWPLDGGDGTGRWATVGRDGDLYIGLDSGELIALHMGANGVIAQRTVGPPGDGLISSRQGHVNFMIAPLVPWLLVAYGGHESGNTASIFAIDYQQRTDPLTGKVYQPWHSMYDESDDNVDLHVLGYSTNDDSVPRLHFGLEGGSTDELFHLERPFTNPVSGVTQKFQSQSNVDWPEDDLQDPHADSVVLNARAETADLSSDDTGEYIEHEYTLDDDATGWNNVSNFGNYISTDKVLFYGKTNQNITGQTEAGDPKGVSCKTIRNRLVLNRDGGDNTQTPYLKEFQFDARNKLNVLLAWNITVDLADTADQYPEDHGADRDPEDVLASLDTVRDSVVAVPFTFGGSGERFVEMLTSSLRAEIIELGGGDAGTNGRRSGQATFRVEELQDV